AAHPTPSRSWPAPPRRDALSRRRWRATSRSPSTPRSPGVEPKAARGQYASLVKLRSVSSGGIRAAFFAVLAVVVFLLFHKVMARSRLAVTGFTWTFLGIPAISLIEDLRRPAGRTQRFEEAPEDAPYESKVSLGPLAWPVALLLWFFLPAGILGAGVNFVIGL